MTKLISSTKFILEQSKLINDSEILSRLLISYAYFLKQTLTLGMFVPCDADGNVLEEPDLTCKRPESKGNCQCGEESIKDCREWWSEWLDAKSRVLFKGFSLECIKLNEESYADIDGYICRGSDFFIHRDNIDYQTIEFLFNYAEELGFEIELTESAKKQIGI